jgi:hypothetical protein
LGIPKLVRFRKIRSQQLVDGNLSLRVVKESSRAAFLAIAIWLNFIVAIVADPGTEKACN